MKFLFIPILAPLVLPLVLHGFVAFHIHRTNRGPFHTIDLSFLDGELTNA
jgi:hypothetical protein